MREVEEQLQSLQRELALKQRELEIVLAIDRIRDTAPGPTAMFSDIAHALAERFQTDFCLLYLVDRETGALKLKVVNEHAQQWQRFEPAALRDLALETLDDGGIATWDEWGGNPAMHLAAIPILMEEDSLGVLLLARARQPFDADDAQLLQTAESQIDSAIIQAYTYHELQQRNKELEAIYRVDQIRDQNLPFDEMLGAVLQELCAIIRAEMGFIMLYNTAGQQLEMRAITHDDLLNEPAYTRIVNRAANEALRHTELVCYEQADDVFCPVMCVPLILQAQIIGVLGTVNRRAGRGFQSDDRRLLRAIVSQMDTAILESLERRRLRRVLSRSLDTNVLERLLARPDVDMFEGERMVLTVLYADLRDSTPLAERVEPELLVDFLNDYLGRMTEALLSHGGTLDKYVGDEVMAIFGAPVPQADHALRAVQVGLEMQAAYQEVAAWWRTRGIETAGLGVGIATGDLVVGEIGCVRRTDYTVIGGAAHLGARICASAQAGQVLVSQATYDLVRDRVEATRIAGLRLKGIEHVVDAYHVTRVLEDGC